MEEFKKFLTLINKYKLLLVIVPLITVIITFFLVRNLPSTYVSQAQLSTGIADEKQNNIINQILPNDQVNQGFSNLIEMFKMKKVLDQVSYLLIIHDLTSKEPFKTPSPLLNTLNADARKHAIEVYTSKYNNSESLNLNDDDQNGLNRVLESMDYHSQGISGKVQVFRSGNSDFLIVQCETENPKLSEFIANTLSQEFIKYYSLIVSQNQLKANTFLSKLLVKKTDTLSKRMTDLRSYKIKNRVLNLDEQSKQLYTNILDFDNKKQAAIQNTSSYAGALNEIDRKFNPEERKYIEAAISKINQDIVATKNEISGVYEAYLQSDFEPRYKSSLDSLQRILNQQIHKSSDQYLLNPLSTKQQLVSEKIRLEIELDLSRYSINALERELDKLNAQFDMLVPKEAEVQALEMNIEIATKEYTEILNKYNESSLESAFSNKLNLIQPAVPGQTKPSKKMLLVILSGLFSVFFCLLLLFALYFLDNSIKAPIELANRTGLPVLGVLNDVQLSSLSLREIWDSKSISPELMMFKNQLRSLRNEIENDLSGRVLTVSSLKGQEGKSFIIMNLAASLVITSKRVLIIDGNFINSNLSKEYTSEIFLEDFFTDQVNLQNVEDSAVISILKNRGGDNSLLEIATEQQIKERFDLLKNVFDIILIDTAATEASNQFKEWVSHSDGILGVFKCGRAYNRENSAYIKYFRSTGLFKGWVMNKY